MRSKICLLVLLLSLAPIHSYALNPNGSAVLELYVKSGMEEQLAQLPSVLRDAFDRSLQEDEQTRNLPKNVQSTLRASIATAFAPEALKKTIVGELGEKLPINDIEEVLKWLDSPLGMKCTRLEEAAGTPEGQADMQKYAARLQSSPPSAERLKIQRELDTATKNTESAVDVAIQTQLAVALAMMATLPAEQQRSLDDLSREMEKLRPTIESSVRSETFLSDLYTYRSLTDAEIRQYIDFAKSPAGAKYHTVSIAAFKRAFLESSVKWGKLIGEVIKGAANNSEA